MSGGIIYPGIRGNSDVNVHNRDSFVATADGASGKSILVPTTLNFSNEEARFWNGLTFFFDKWWEPEASRITLPFCMFQIAQFSDAQQVEVSKKRVMVYQSPNAGKTDAEIMASGSAMQTIVDNILVQPKSYNLTLVVPASPVGRWIKSRMQLKTYLQQVLSGFEDGLDENTRAFMEGEMSRMADTKVLMQDFINMGNVVLPNTQMAANDTAANMANKNSLDAMIERGRIIMFKTWMGSDYKYVLITNKTAEKRGNEDGVWRVSLTVQELPVLSLTPAKQVEKASNRGWVQGYTDRWGKVFGLKNLGTDMPAFTGTGGTEDADEA